MSVITIDTTSLGLGAKQLAAMSKELEAAIDDVLNVNILEIDEKAKQLAPADRGFLRQHISANTSKHLSKEINVNTPYAAWMEFGTGMYAAQYVASLPSDWQQFALQFKGDKGKASIKGILFLLQDWFHRHGINDKQHAFFIARKIFINGIRPHSFLYPAFKAQEPQMLKDINNAIKALIK